MTSRTANWPLVWSVAVITRCRRFPTPRAASQMARPAMSAKATSTTAARSGDASAEEQRDREQRTELARSRRGRGRSRRTGCRSSPESRSTGMIVPSAVEVRAMPMNTPAAGRSGASRMPRPTPTTSDMIHPSAARLQRSSPDGGEVDLVAGEEEEHREAEVGEQRR